ncbi:GNAT family N-acetyltransferase [Brachybacterium sp. YJGR34]|uniref:GNAT family N-acetyltransferase n=1 Tax=Brachybacterium sp. YJGR34 TaxID=2059911 RepID=UPI001300A6FC|nr:GNAT family N-acetyltransferase [Brachybacterium sp. YJGR34]
MSPDDDRRAVVASDAVRTARLLLRPVGPPDLEALFALHSDPRAFAQDLTEPLTEPEQMRRVLAHWIERRERTGRGYLTLRAAPGAALPPGLLGVVGLMELETEQAPALSAYWRLDPAATGRGVASEAMRAVLADPLHGPRGQEVLAVTAARNTPSRALAARLGFLPAPVDRPVPGDRDGDVLLVLPPGATGRP